ncbi:MAG: hypothetical protein HQM02_03270 [Magnetococcales bacterium]|nr:hypothetical protein [Magnetococcales bacterium]
MKILSAGILLTAWLGIAFAAPAQAAIHRKACETPFKGVSVCWDVTGDEMLDVSPYAELHLLPIARQIAGQPEVLVDLSRTIFRQLLPGNLAERLIPEWTPAYYLEGALAISQKSSWPAVLWISPREMRAASATSSGLLDWDVYLIAKGRLLRTLRIRVESVPAQKSDGVQRAAVMGTALVATGAATGAVGGSIAAVAGAYAMGQSMAPEAGQPIELLSELATRQILFLFQQPIENLPGPVTERDGNPWSVNHVVETAGRPFSAK